MDEEKQIPEKEEGKEVYSHEEGKLTKKMRENPWILSTFVLGVLGLILLISNFGGMTGGTITGGVVDEGVAGNSLLTFANEKGANAELVGVSEESGLYKVILKIEDQEAPFYVTKNGEYYIPPSYLIPLIETAQPSQQQTTEIPKSDKPEVELFVMSFCPYGVEAQKIFYPVWNALEYVADFRVRFIDYIMHGKEEIDENLVQYCIQEEEYEKYSNYLRCFVDSKDTDFCLSEAKISKNEIDKCIENTDKKFGITEKYNDESTWLSGRYPLFAVETEIVKGYGVQGSESLIINGVKVSPSEYRWSPEKLKQIICSAFNNAPSECFQQLGEGSEGNVQGGCA